jgi:hypothetical protein
VFKNTEKAGFSRQKNALICKEFENRILELARTAKNGYPAMNSATSLA